MRIVLQCAASKKPNAGCLVSAKGLPVAFRARPEEEPTSHDLHFAHPDDPRGGGETWRKFLTAYNRDPGANSLGLLPASKLYRHPAYEAVDAQVGSDRLLILSAGWGLLPSTFLTPAYDITFSNAPRAKRRTRSICFEDYRLLPVNATDPLIFVGGIGYWSLFGAVTEGYGGRRVIVHASERKPAIPGTESVQYGRRYTNWHYEAAQDIASGVFDPLSASPFQNGF